MGDNWGYTKIAVISILTQKEHVTALSILFSEVENRPFRITDHALGREQIHQNVQSRSVAHTL